MPDDDLLSHGGEDRALERRNRGAADRTTADVHIGGPGIPLEKEGSHHAQRKTPGRRVTIGGWNINA